MSEDPGTYRVASQPRSGGSSQDAASRRMYAAAALGGLISRDNYPEGSVKKLTRLAFEFADKMMEEERIDWIKEGQAALPDRAE